jgi:hypothetical protein
VETDTFSPTKKQFTSIFNKVGGKVWEEWDQYLENQVDDGITNQLGKMWISLRQANRSRGYQ